MKVLKFNKKIVTVIIISNIVFTTVVLCIFFRTGSEPTVLIAAWFAFTTGELGALAGLKHSENKNGRKDAE